MTRYTFIGLTFVAALMCGPIVLADTQEPPLYVASSGTDRGNCLDAAAPCQTIDYALSKVGKNGRIQVAEGHYVLESPENVFYLVSNAISVQAASGSTLVGVPHEFAIELGARGFRVIADGKSLNQSVSDDLVAMRNGLQSSVAATSCTGGFAGVYPCSNVDLLAHEGTRASTTNGADIWGFMDLNTSREYAIMGYGTGIAVYDVTDAENPREVGFVQGQSTVWRDIKVYQFWNADEERWNAYAYIIADSTTDGLFVVDLTDLPHRVSRVSYGSDFQQAHNVYITKTDPATGLPVTADDPVLVVAGSNRASGRFRTYSLADPTSPAFLATPATPADQPGGDRLYMHDAASMIVTDARKDTQCVNAGASPYCDVLFDFNESTVDIWDVTNPSNPQRLSRVPYGNSRYTHSGWWSEDKQFLFVQDELDERDRGLPTTLRVFSISDLGNPTQVGAWTGPTFAIDHNGFVRGNRYYMSNYTRGLTVLDITNAANPIAVGQFDSFPSSDVTNFPGAWGTYPFLPSGNILISDIDRGLYVVADNTRDVPEGTLSFSSSSFGGEETATAALSVERVRGTTGAISVDWEIVFGNATEADVSVSTGTLNWAANDAAAKTINFDLSNDGMAEGMERVLVRLTAPTGGATLSSPNIANFYINDPGSTASVEFTASDIAVTERGFGSAIATVKRTGSATGAVSVDFATTAGSATAGVDYNGPAAGTLSWADGDATPKSIEFLIVDDSESESKEDFAVTLSNASGASIAATSALNIEILNGTGANNSPNSVAGASQTVPEGTRVTLDGTTSNDPDGDALIYAWVQTLGPAVALDDPSVAQPRFTAPGVSSGTLLIFDLTVTDTDGLSDTSNVSITVTPSGGNRNGGGGGGAISPWVLAMLLAILLFERVRLYDRLIAIRTR